MNKLTIIGNLTGDPELRTTQERKSVCNFNVAVNRRRSGNGQPEADFFRVSAWEGLGENCSKYLAKGRKVAVVGPVSCRAYQTQKGESRASLEVLAQEVEFLSPRAESVDQQTGMQKVEPAGNPFDDEERPY